MTIPKKPGPKVLQARTIQGMAPEKMAQAPHPLVEERASDQPPVQHLVEDTKETSVELEVTSIIKITDRDYYRLHSMLGQGGMGVVYRATHVVESLRREKEIAIATPAAVKVISFDEDYINSDPAGPEAAMRKLNDRFETEVRLAANLVHENIVRIDTYGEMDDGNPFYVMELLKGMDLGAILAERMARGDGPFPWQQAMGHINQVCSALDFAHRKKVIHRDIKPMNIFLVRNSEGDERIKVLDFGLAKLLHATGPEHTQKGEGGMGTPDYMSPEQAVGLESTDHRTDIYSVGAMMYELVTGQPPFSFIVEAKRDTQTSDEYYKYMQDKWIEIRNKIWEEKPRPLRLANPGIDVPDELEQIIFRCLEKDPAKRFQSAKELKEAIAKLNGNGYANGKMEVSHAAGGVVDPPQSVIVEDASLVDLADGMAAGRMPSAPKGAPAAQEEEDDDRKKTLPRYEKTEIVRVRNTVQDESKHARTMLPMRGRKKLSKWLLIGTIAGSVAVSGIGVGIVVGTRNPDNPAQSQNDGKAPGRAPPLVPRPGEPIAEPAIDAGTEAAPAQDAGTPEGADSAPQVDTPAETEYKVVFRTGLPGVEILIRNDFACSTSQDGTCTLTVPEGTDPLEFTLRKRGYTPVRQSVIPDREQDVRVTMERIERRPPRTPPGKQPPGHRPSITSEE